MLQVLDAAHRHVRTWPPCQKNTFNNVLMLQVLDAAHRHVRTNAARKRFAAAMCTSRFYEINEKGQATSRIGRDKQAALLLMLSISKGTWTTLRVVCCAGWLSWDTIDRV
jgi:hypothetical protein